MSEPPAGARDPHNLRRFVEAQAANYHEALAELKAGRKRTHWSWYVLPQIRGLGASEMSMRYAISGLAEAAAYLAHPTLGARLCTCVAVMNAHAGSDAAAILGEVDAQKFQSCLTLFVRVAEEGAPFRAALRKYFSGAEDAATLAILERQAR